MKVGSRLKRPVVGRGAVVLGLHGSDVCPYRRPDGHEEREENEATLVTRLVEVAVHHQVGEVRRGAVPKIHQKKSEIVEDIDRCDRVTEFDTVEQARLAVQQADVAQVQIAMATAYFSSGFPAVEEGRVANERRAQRAIECVDFRCIEDAAGEESDFVDGENGRQVGGTATAMPDRSGIMKVGDRAGD